MTFPHAPATTRETDDWYTPPAVFAWLGAVGHTFDMDVCSPGPLIVPWVPAKEHVTPAQDGLKTPWRGLVWCNPPYSTVGQWVARFLGHGNGVILTNASCDTAWFQRLVHDPCAVFFPAGRVRFIHGGTMKASKAPPRPQVLVGIGAGEALVRGAQDRGRGTLLVRH